MLLIHSDDIIRYIISVRVIAHFSYEANWYIPVHNTINKKFMIYNTLML